MKIFVEMNVSAAADSFNHFSAVPRIIIKVKDNNSNSKDKKQMLLSVVIIGDSI